MWSVVESGRACMYIFIYIYIYIYKEREGEGERAHSLQTY